METTLSKQAHQLLEAHMVANAQTIIDANERLANAYAFFHSGKSAGHILISQEMGEVAVIMEQASMIHSLLTPLYYMIEASHDHEIVKLVTSYQQRFLDNVLARCCDDSEAMHQGYIQAYYICKAVVKELVGTN